MEFPFPFLQEQVLERKALIFQRCFEQLLLAVGSEFKPGLAVLRFIKWHVYGFRR